MPFNNNTKTDIQIRRFTFRIVIVFLLAITVATGTITLILTRKSSQEMKSKVVNLIQANTQLQISNLNQYLGSYALSAAVMGQCITYDSEIAAFAAENGISEGKAYLIKTLAASDSRLTEAGLLKLSTQELILLASEKSSDKTPAVSYGEVNKSQYIGKDKALNIALAKAGLKKSQISGCEVEFECDDGNITYDIEFYCGSAEYEFEIDATTGNIIEYETDGDGYEGSHHKNSADNSGSKYIGRSRAKEIALAKAGLTASQIHDYEIELDDGEYEIDFKYQNMEYEVDIDAKSGKILKFDKEYDD